MLKFVEKDPLSLLREIQTGAMSISDLMGPLSGVKGLTSTSTGRLSSHRELEHQQISEHDLTVGDDPVEFLPLDDQSNQILIANVHPLDYLNPNPSEDYDLVVIGAGVSGLLSVITGKWLGKRCALVESHAMGGDCLNIGCVPSKAFIASAKVLRDIKSASKFGIHLPIHEVRVDFAAIMTRMRKIRADISPHDSVERYSKDFCEHVYIGTGSFSPDQERTIIVKGDDGTQRSLRYQKAMIATGASASIPEFLQHIPHLTNKNFFNLLELPPRLVSIGCGPVTLELSQACALFGCQVICIENTNSILHREDADAAELLHQLLEQDGITFLTNTRVVSVSIEMNCGHSLYSAPWPLYVVTVLNTITGIESTLTCEALFNATGRAPNVRHLELDKVGVSFDQNRGVHINDHFETSNPDIYSCGDCASQYKFTHAADFQARLAVRNMFLDEGNRLSDLLIPWCTYTYPEIAHVGKYEHELQRTDLEFEVFTRPLALVDRCRCDGIENGFVKLIVERGCLKILGCTIVAPNAGDMITEVTVCMQHDLSVAQLAGVIHPYPTTQEAVRQCALQCYKYFKDPNGSPMKTLQLYMNQLHHSSYQESGKSPGLETIETP